MLGYEDELAMIRHAWIAMLGLGLLGCGETLAGVACPAIAAAGLGVDVTNAATMQPLCDANVIATDGSSSERLQPASCHYFGAYERPGTYAIAVSRPGFASREVSSVRVVMGGGQCPHVEQTHVSVALTPEG
jgi:hypothetical protein